MAEDPADTPRPLAEISHGPSAFEAFLDRNQKGMIVLGIGIVAATAAWIVFRGIKDSEEKTAGGVLSRAEAIADLQQMVKDHPDTAAAGSAQVLIATKQWEAGDQDAAIETLRGFIAAKPQHPAVPTARASLASRLMQQGKADEATASFRELAGDPAARFLAPYALVSLGDSAKAAGKVDEAEQAYKRAQNDFGTNPFATGASQNLKLLRFKAPAEIEAPPAPEPKKEGDPTAPPLPEGAEVPKELEGPLGDILSGEPAPPPAELPPVEPQGPPVEAPPQAPKEGESN